MHKRWSNDEVQLLRANYRAKGSTWCMQYLKRTRASVKRKAGQLLLCLPPSTEWTQKELEILQENYPKGGVQLCRIDRSIQAISTKARKLGISCKSYVHRATIDRLENEIFFECEKHGKVDFYIRPNGNNAPKCVMCINDYNRNNHRKRSNSFIYKYRNRIRSSFSRCLKNNNFTRSGKLPYSSQELCDYLEDIKRKQDNQCPMCSSSYDVVEYDIDHIVPVHTAKTVQDLKRLFELKNLSILCWYCNRHVKRGRIQNVS